MWRKINNSIHLLSESVKAIAHLIYALLLLSLSCASIYAFIKAITYAHQLANKPFWMKLLGI